MTIPTAFSWLQENDVSTKLNIEHVKGIITPAGSDQGDCEACWAFHLAQVVSDRIRIKYKINNFQQLSPMQLLREASYHEGDGGGGCCGGSFEEGLELLQKNGISTLCCHQYHIPRGSNNKCKSAYFKESDVFLKNKESFKTIFPNSINSEIERISWKNCVVTDDNEKRYKIKKRSHKELSTSKLDQRSISQSAVKIKKDIYTYGPIVCRITIFPDFLKEITLSRPFDATNGIYMIIPGESSLYQKKHTFVGGTCCTGKTNCQVSGHGLAIVGWGVREYRDVPQSGKIAADILGLNLSSTAVQKFIESVDYRWKTKPGGYIRLDENDYAQLLKRSGLKEHSVAKLVEVQQVPYWILRNSWGRQRHKGEYAQGIINVAFCDMYIIGGQKRRVNLTFGVEYRFDCGTIYSGLFNNTITLCGGAISPGIPEDVNFNLNS